MEELIVLINYLKVIFNNKNIMIGDKIKQGISRISNYKNKLKLSKTKNPKEFNLKLILTYYFQSQLLRLNSEKSGIERLEAIEENEQRRVKKIEKIGVNQVVPEGKKHILNRNQNIGMIKNQNFFIFKNKNLYMINMRQHEL